MQFVVYAPSCNLFYISYIFESDFLTVGSNPVVFPGHFKVFNKNPSRHSTMAIITEESRLNTIIRVASFKLSGIVMSFRVFALSFVFCAKQLGFVTASVVRM